MDHWWSDALRGYAAEGWGGGFGVGRGAAARDVRSPRAQLPPRGTKEPPGGGGGATGTRPRDRDAAGP